MLLGADSGTRRSPCCLTARVGSRKWTRALHAVVARGGWVPAPPVSRGRHQSFTQATSAATDRRPPARGLPSSSSPTGDFQTTIAAACCHLQAAARSGCLRPTAGGIRFQAVLAVRQLRHADDFALHPVPARTVFLVFLRWAAVHLYRRVAVGHRRPLHGPFRLHTATPGQGPGQTNGNQHSGHDPFRQVGYHWLSPRTSASWEPGSRSGTPTGACRLHHRGLIGRVASPYATSRPQLPWSAHCGLEARSARQGRGETYVSRGWSSSRACPRWRGPTPRSPAWEYPA